MDSVQLLLRQAHWHFGLQKQAAVWTATNFAQKDDAILLLLKIIKHGSDVFIGISVLLLFSAVFILRSAKKLKNN